MSRSKSWWWSKANALAEAAPALELGGLLCLLAVATHETSAGDAWPGSCNWGATTRGPLTGAEHAELVAASVYPVLEPSSAREACEARATEVLGERDDRQIHVDSRPGSTGARMGFMHHAAASAAASPGLVVYFTWFAAFRTDVEGAAYFVGFFHAASEHAAIAAGNSDALARAMYSAHYYTGQSPVAEEDIDAYAHALRPLVAEARAALVGWTPGAVAAVEPAQDWTWQDVQSALNDAGAAARLTVDGAVGPLTRAAMRAFQGRLGLPVTGEADEATVQALRAGPANA